MQKEENRIFLSSPYFSLEFDSGKGTVSALYYPEDVYPTDYLAKDRGEGLGSYRIEYLQNGLREVLCSREKSRETGFDSHAVRFAQHGEKLLVRQNFCLPDEGKCLTWEINVKNRWEEALEIDDFRLELPMHSDFVRDAQINYTKRVIRHSFISANGSFIYWQRPNGVFPCMVMTCGRDTFLTDFDHDESDAGPGWPGTYRVYIHSRLSGRPWARGKYARTILGPGEERSFVFYFRWAFSYEEIRDILYESGRPDVAVLPGMVVPEGMDSFLAVRMKGDYALEAPKGLQCQRLKKQGEYDIYRLTFAKTGEIVLPVAYGEEKSYLEFFYTLPLEELIRSRAVHIVEYQQYRGEKWYDGLFSLWNMEQEFMLTPERQDGIPPYCTGGADDPGLCKAAYVAQKNCYMPRENEIEAVEYYIEHFLWGGLQRKDTEKIYPYGIYGSDCWYENRNCGSGYENGGHGQERLWRTFDYTHIVGLYWYMYLIARNYPEKVHYLDWQGYLSRAYHTAIAFFEVPYSIFMKNGWDFCGYTDWAFKQGNFHESQIPYLICELEKEGYTDRAGKLRGYWEQKVMYMIHSRTYPFGSEMWFDTTAFESVQAVAKYAMEHRIETPVVFYDKNRFGPGDGGERVYAEVGEEKVRGFMEKGIRANLAARGCLGPTYYQLGSDVRTSGDNQYQLSYMSQLGGWALMDYALNWAEAGKEDYLRTAYASFLSSFMLIHTGEDYPWYPSDRNKGAAGWAFEPEREGRMWLKKDMLAQRGPWRYDGEIDNGFQGALRTACSVCYEDHTFGLVYLGGRLRTEKDGERYVLEPGDGIRRKVYLFCFGHDLSVESGICEIRKVIFDCGSEELEIFLADIQGEEAVYRMRLEKDGGEKFWQTEKMMVKWRKSK